MVCGNEVQRETRSRDTRMHARLRVLKPHRMILRLILIVTVMLCFFNDGDVVVIHHDVIVVRMVTDDRNGDYKT